MRWMTNKTCTNTNAYIQYTSDTGVCIAPAWNHYQIDGAMKFAPTKNISDFRGLSPHPLTHFITFSKIAIFEKPRGPTNLLQKKKTRMPDPDQKWSSNNSWLELNTAGTRNVNKPWQCSVQRGPSFRFRGSKTWPSCPLSAYYSTG